MPRPLPLKRDLESKPADGSVEPVHPPHYTSWSTCPPHGAHRPHLSPVCPPRADGDSPAATSNRAGGLVSQCHTHARTRTHPRTRTRTRTSHIAPAAAPH